MAWYRGLVLLLLIVGFAFAAFEGSEDGKSRVSDRDAKLLAFFSSTTITSVATSTKLAVSTCLSTTAAACTGRRKRRTVFLPKNIGFSEISDSDGMLEGSLDGKDLPLMPIEEGPNTRKGKKMTIWSTGFTTVTVTTTSYYSGTTVTISALCTVSGQTQQCFG